VWEGVSPPQPTRGFGERRKLPQCVWGKAPAENDFGALQSCQKATGGSNFQYFELYILH